MHLSANELGENSPSMQKALVCVCNVPRRTNEPQKSLLIPRSQPLFKQKGFLSLLQHFLKVYERLIKLKGGSGHVNSGDMIICLRVPRTLTVQQILPSKLS